MTQAQLLKKVRRSLGRWLDRISRRAYQEGFEAGLARAHGTGRRGRTIRGDATVAGLIRIIERHFSLGRYGFEVRIVHSRSGRKVATGDQIRKYRVPPPN
jgi:hypothetical protein